MSTFDQALPSPPGAMPAAPPAHQNTISRLPVLETKTGGCCAPDKHVFLHPSITLRYRNENSRSIVREAFSGRKDQSDPYGDGQIGLCRRDLGIAPSQVAAVAVSEYVAAKAIAFGAAEKTGQQMIEAMTPHMAEMFQNLRTRKSTNADSSRHPPRRNRSRWWHQQKPGK